MKVPKDIDGETLVKLLKCYGYKVLGKKAATWELRHWKNRIHHITIPKHNPLKVGTLSSIIDDVAEHFELSKNEVLDELFNK